MNQRSTIAAVVAVAAILVGAVFAVELPAAPAHAGWGSWSGTSPAFSGGTITSGITFSGVTTDIATAGSEDLTIAPGGDLVVGGSAGIRVRNSATTMLSIGTAGSSYFVVQAAEPRVQIPNAASMRLGANSFLAFASANQTVTTSATPASSFLRIDAAGAVNWTPGAPATAMSEAVTACSIDASHTITMTDGATYEGSGCALAVNDCVTMIYDTTTTKWRELSCSDN